MIVKYCIRIFRYFDRRLIKARQGSISHCNWKWKWKSKIWYSQQKWMNFEYRYRVALFRVDTIQRTLNAVNIWSDRRTLYKLNMLNFELEWIVIKWVGEWEALDWLLMMEVRWNAKRINNWNCNRRNQKISIL
jgi:hypothetical protein